MSNFPSVIDGLVEHDLARLLQGSAQRTSLTEELRGVELPMALEDNGRERIVEMDESESSESSLCSNRSRPPVKVMSANRSI
jgi:hypothetical protein